MPVKKENPKIPQARKTAPVPKPRKWTAEEERHIAELAYRYFLCRGGQHGCHVEDWLRAEADFAGTLQSAPSKQSKKRDSLLVVV
jgi:hypothetical protein